MIAATQPRLAERFNAGARAVFFPCVTTTRAPDLQPVKASSASPELADRADEDLDPTAAAGGRATCAALVARRFRVDPCAAATRTPALAASLTLAASLALALLALASPAHAAPGWSLGVDVHGTDNAFAIHRPLGLAMGLRSGSLEGALVVDPTVLVNSWEMLDATLGGWIADDRIAPFVGWRNTSGPTHGGRRYDEAVLLGADVVAIKADHFRLEFGAELAASVWRHGAGIPDNTISFAFNADLASRMELMFHLRFKLTGKTR